MRARLRIRKRAGTGTSRIDSNKCGGARVLTGVLLAYSTPSSTKNPCLRWPITPSEGERIFLTRQSAGRRARTGVFRLPNGCEWRGNPCPYGICWSQWDKPLSLWWKMVSHDPQFGRTCEVFVRFGRKRRKDTVCYVTAVSKMASL